MNQIKHAIGQLTRLCANWQDFGYLAILTFSVISAVAMLEEYREAEGSDLSTSLPVVQRVSQR